jgi:dihydrodipicolinate synthase/N-acetylneuraminate lyase
MDTRPIDSRRLAASVIAVPPVARHTDRRWNVDAIGRLIRHLESGGVSALLYGGNGALAHAGIGEYAALLDILEDAAGDETLVIPAAGPGFGMMLEQAALLRGRGFPTAMVLPSKDPSTPAGLATAFRRFAEALGRPAVLYLKQEDSLDIDTIARLLQDGAIAAIKYAIVRPDPRRDDYLRRLIDCIGTTLMVSGIGEQPAAVHMADFGMVGYTAGCVCIAPRLSTAMMRAVQAGDSATADAVRALFQPLEGLRDAINPVTVLHEAVELAGIAETGSITPPLSPLSAEDRERTRLATVSLLAAERSPAIPMSPGAKTERCAAH